MPMIIPIDAGRENHIGGQLRDCSVRQFSRGEDHCELSAGTLAPGDDECTGTRAQTPTASRLPSLHNQQLDSVAVSFSASL